MHAPYDEARFLTLQQQYRDGQLGEAPELPAEALHPLKDGDITALPAAGTPAHAQALALGESALRRGELAAVIVAGGAGTRFGSRVKGLVPLEGEKTFLDFKLEDAERVAQAYGKPVPVAMMTSRVTHEPIQGWLDAHPRPHVQLFQQAVFPRLTPEGELYRDDAGEPSYAPSGHGDFFRAIVESGVAAKLHAQGVRHLFFSNVDNLAATVDPLVFGVHLQLAHAMTLEVTARRSPTGALDVGAAPVRYHGALQLIEKVDPERFDFISTNNMFFDLTALLAAPVPLPVRAMKKNVEGKKLIQLEQVTAEATSLTRPDGSPLLSFTFIEVPRTPASRSRFEPVKTPDDLGPAAEHLRERLAAR